MKLLAALMPQHNFRVRPTLSRSKMVLKWPCTVQALNAQCLCHFLVHTALPRSKRELTQNKYYRGGAMEKDFIDTLTHVRASGPGLFRFCSTNVRTESVFAEHGRECTVGLDPIAKTRRSTYCASRVRRHYNDRRNI